MNRNKKQRAASPVPVPKRSKRHRWLIFGAGTALMTAVLVCFPAIKAWHARIQYEAEWQRAEEDRTQRLLEAQAAYDIAHLNAQAEIRRAEGIAEANRMIAASLGGAERYLRWLHLEMLRQSVASVETEPEVFEASNIMLPLDEP